MSEASHELSEEGALEQHIADQKIIDAMPRIQAQCKKHMMMWAYEMGKKANYLLYFPKDVLPEIEIVLSDVLSFVVDKDGTRAALFAEAKRGWDSVYGWHLGWRQRLEPMFEAGASREEIIAEIERPWRNRPEPDYAIANLLRTIPEEIATRRINRARQAKHQRRA